MKKKLNVLLPWNDKKRNIKYHIFNPKDTLIADDDF